MTTQGVDLSTLQKNDITKLLAWMIAMPVLAFWPLISFWPLFQLFARDNSTLDIVVQLVFLSTGALGVIGVALLMQFLITEEARAAFHKARQGSALKIALYAAVWSASYIGYNIFY